MPSFGCLQASSEYYDIDPASIKSPPNYVSPPEDSFAVRSDSYAYGLTPLPIPIVTSSRKRAVEASEYLQKYCADSSPCIMKPRPNVLERDKTRNGLSLKPSDPQHQSGFFESHPGTLVKTREIGAVRGWSVDDHIEAWVSCDNCSTPGAVGHSPTLNRGLSSLYHPISAPNLMTGILHSRDMRPVRSSTPIPCNKIHGPSSTLASSSLQDHISSVKPPTSNEPRGKCLEGGEIDEDADESDCLSPFWGSTSDSDSDNDIPNSLPLSPNYPLASDYSKEAVFLYDLRMERARNRMQSTLKRERNLRTKDRLACGIEPLEQGLSPTTSFEIDSSQARHPAGRPRLRIFFRKIVVDWLLKVSPSPRATPTTLATHLHASTETRFHAVQLFDRYVYLQGMCCFRESTKTRPAVGEIEDAAKLHYWIWDVALSCLALSVKMHHDFTNPLHPIHSTTFRSLARYSISHEQFEIAQQHVLKSLDYQIYNTTPHAYFLEVFDALPSVRCLIRFSDSWARVMDLVWGMMHFAMLDSDLLRYPVSLLTAATLVEALADLITIEENRAGRHQHDMHMHPCNISVSEDLTDDLGMAIEDIRDILDVSQTDLDECRDWISGLREF